MFTFARENEYLEGEPRGGRPEGAIPTANLHAEPFPNDLRR